MDNNNTSKNFSFSDIPWKYIIMAIIFGCLVWAVILVINAIGNVAKPFIDILGDVAKTAAGIISPCVPQQDCTKMTPEQCGSTAGCSCGSNDKCNCQIVTGKQVGDGGLWSFGCLPSFGLGFLAVLLAGFLLSIVKSRFTKSSDVLKDLSTASGEKVTDIVKKLTDKTLADAKETSDKMEKQTGEKPTKDVIDTIIRDKLNKNLTNECIKEATTGIASVEERKALIEAQYQDKKVQDDMIEKKKEQLSEKQREIMNEKDGSEPPAEKPEIK